MMVAGRRDPGSAEKGWVPALVGLGSNLGDRRANLERAVELSSEHPDVRWTRLSTWRETEPVGGPAQGRYLNGAGEIVTRLEPDVLLEWLQDVERRLCRVRDVRFGPRTIDLDLLAYGDRVIERRDLVVPHPRICERAFVLEPLAEIVPDWIHPLTGKTFHEHWKELEVPGGGAATSHRGEGEAPAEPSKRDGPERAAGSTRDGERAP